MSNITENLISVKLPDGSKMELEKNSTVADLAKKIAESLFKKAIAAKVDDQVVDLYTTLQDGQEVKILTPDNPETLAILRHSTAHIMAQAVQNLFPQARIAIGPNIETGFYYDFLIPDHNLTPEDLPKIEDEMKNIIKSQQKFIKMKIEDVTKQLKEFKNTGEKFKAELLEEYAAHNPTLYACVDKNNTPVWNDFCRGPHIPDTKFIKVFKLLSVAGSYWRGDVEKDVLQRIYGTAFWTKEDLESYLNWLEEAEKRDHRKLGNLLDLFSIREECGPGLILWHPNLSIVREEIENYWREEHRKRGYDIVYSPHIAKSQLWDISGHNSHFKENMYYMNIDEQEYVLKPMNCPFHILIYQAQRRSYRHLPLRWGELGTVYRYEKSGALHGMTRVRGFTQDDAHIFCTPEQFTDEIKAIIDFVDSTLKLFGMEYEVELSTRPEDKYVGTLEAWDKAEKGLIDAMKEYGLEYEVNEGDGAFYGPKIDFKLKDALNRTWQGATIQLDFNLPERFDLKYSASDGTLKTPVMIHRVIFGTMERFMGVLIEHFSGAFPTWLSPKQAIIIPVAERHYDYAGEVTKTLKNIGIRAHLDDRSETVNHKIREAQLSKSPYMIIVGDKEVDAKNISLRVREIGDLGTKNLDDFISKVSEEIKSKALKSSYS
ncbi:MAG: threonine--tRNA ligase [Cyanobacteriota bacterium]